MYSTQKYESPLSIGITSETIFSFFFFFAIFPFNEPGKWRVTRH